MSTENGFNYTHAPGICAHAERCGGCAYQGIPYHEQLDLKNAQVLDHLLQNDVRCGEYHPMQPSPHIMGYRNKMEYSFGDEVKDGPMTLGLHKTGSYMSVIDTDGCMIVPNDFDIIRIAVLDYAKKSGHGHYKKRMRSGFLRNLVLRCGERTGELLINLVTTDEETLDETAFTDLIKGQPLTGTVVGILHTINNGRADTVACDSYKVLHGRDHYFEELMGLRFRVNAFSFFQTNTSAVEHMFHEAFEMLPDIADRKVFDVYCGTGTISLALSDKAGEVIGVEIVSDSVRAAEENAAFNGITNCRFIEGDAFEVLNTLKERPDVLAVDPPRMGMHPKALTKIVSYGLEEILYISCNPKTFCQNMASLAYAGYRLDTLRAYDNFPITKHIELAARIVRR